MLKLDSCLLLALATKSTNEEGRSTHKILADRPKAKQGSFISPPLRRFPSSSFHYKVDNPACAARPSCFPDSGAVLVLFYLLRSFTASFSSTFTSAVLPSKSQPWDLCPWLRSKYLSQEQFTHYPTSLSLYTLILCNCKKVLSPSPVGKWRNFPNFAHHSLSAPAASWHTSLAPRVQGVFSTDSAVYHCAITLYRERQRCVTLNSANTCWSYLPS